MEYPRYALRPQHRGQHSDTVTVGTRRFVSRKRLRFRAHNHRPYIRCDLDYAVESAIQIFRLRPQLPARLRQMLVTDSIIFQQLPQHRPIKLRPTRPRNAPHVADKLDLKHPQKLKKISKRMPSVADGVDCKWIRQQRFYSMIAGYGPAMIIFVTRSELSATAIGPQSPSSRLNESLV